MCWMSVYAGTDSVERAWRACRGNEMSSGGHSWGIAVVVDGELRFAHGVGFMPGDPPEDVASVDADVALVHTRYATRGEITVENAHPFPVENDDGETIAALAHNGTWYDAPKNTGRCDSYYIAKLLETAAAHAESFRDAVRTVGEITGETITVVHRDGTGYTYSGRFTITESANCVRSSGGTPIPDGEVTAL